MSSKLFPDKKPKSDIVFWFIGVIALVLVFLLQDYWVFHPLRAGFSEHLEQIIDSAVISLSLPKDSVTVQVEASTEESIIEGVKKEYGAKARIFLDSADVQHILYRITIRKKEQGSIGLSFGSGNRPRSNGKEKIPFAEEGLRTLWLNEQLQIVGEQRLYQQAMPRVDVMRSTTVSLQSNFDTLAIRDILLATISSSLVPKNLKWTRDTSLYDGIGFIGVVSEDNFIRREYNLKAIRITDKPEKWFIEWSKQIRLVHPKNKENTVGSGLSIESIVQIVFWVLVVCAVFVLFVVFLQRVRMKAIALWVLLLAPLSGVALTLVAFSMIQMPWFIYLFLILFYTIGYGFVLHAMPLATLVSLLHELIAEKFYTIMRFVHSPWKSYHWGRMILMGASLGAVYSASAIMLVSLGEYFDVAILSHSNMKSSMYMVAFIMRNPIAALANVLFSTLPTAMVITFVGVVLAYKFFPRRWTASALFLFQMSLWGIFYSTQTLNVGYIFFHALLYSIFIVWITKKYDVLALMVFLGISTVILSFGLFGSVWWAIYLPLALIAITITVALKAMFNTPESVSEADYKPDFVTLIEENERLHQEIAAAKSVQQKLLPRNLPVIERVRLSAACIPAYEVGGDYYDFFPLDEKRLGVLIGDVSGKGISAAFYITLAKGVIVSQVRGSGSPSDVLHRVNALLYGVMERGKFVSMIYGIYDISTREFSFANAGHNPLVVLRANGDIATVAAKGMAIGLDKGERFEKAVSTMSVSLEENDCVLLYTDGVTEAMNTDHAEYGEERMIAALRTAPLRADDIVSTALADVRKFAGKAHQHDDITLVALQAV